MIDSFPFESFLLEDGSLDSSVGSFWPYAGDAAASESFTDGSGGTWVLTILGMLSIFFAFVGWFWYEHQRLKKATERIRTSGRWTPAPPRSPGFDGPSE
jgi:hypothetical protein